MWKLLATVAPRALPILEKAAEWGGRVLVRAAPAAERAAVAVGSNGGTYSYTISTTAQATAQAAASVGDDVVVAAGKTGLWSKFTGACSNYWKNNGIFSKAVDAAVVGSSASDVINAADGRTGGEAADTAVLAATAVLGGKFRWLKMIGAAVGLDFLQGDLRESAVSVVTTTVQGQEKGLQTAANAIDTMDGFIDRVRGHEQAPAPSARAVAEAKASQQAAREFNAGVQNGTRDPSTMLPHYTPDQLKQMNGVV